MIFIHGSNLEQKETHRTKYRDNLSKQYLQEIRATYDQWKEKNISLKGPFSVESKSDTETLTNRVKLLNEYKDFLDQQHYAEQFDSRSNLHSSVLEEFLYFLFKDMVQEISGDALIGKCHAFKDIFFRPSNFSTMVNKIESNIEKKDHDFAIGVSVLSSLKCKGNQDPEIDEWDIPAVAIECKTYLDKTMLQDASTAADQLKQKNPNAMYIVCAEWLKLTDSVNLKKYKIDQIYVLRKQKNTDREYRYADEYVKNPIYHDVVEHLFKTVRDYLTTDWEGGVSESLNKGFLL
jgi:hypothetical protein